VLAAKAKVREERNKAPSTTIKRDQSGHAYIIDSETKQAILLASDNKPPTSSSDTALATVATDSFPKEWYSLMSAVDHFEYEAVFLEDHSASVNWHKRRSVVADTFLAASINSNSHTKLSSDVGPFILNSGTTIHISSDTSNFFELRAIPPWTIKGIGGSSINATGLRKIHLHLAKGHHYS
jgi:hypothetical protein